MRKAAPPQARADAGKPNSCWRALKWSEPCGLAARAEAASGFCARGTGLKWGLSTTERTMEREDKIDALLGGLEPLLFHEKARVRYLQQEGWPAREIALEIAVERRLVGFRRALSRDGLSLTPRQATALAAKIRRGCGLQVALALARAAATRADE